MQINLKKIQAEKPIKELIEFSIVNLDKPSGPTSFSSDEIVKKLFGINKSSHFGTLDPMVTGVLPVALGRACRLMPYFIGRKKEYIGIMNTHEDIPIDALKKEIKNFIGKIIQMPPLKSRVKRQERQREIYSFEIIEKEGREIIFKAEVEAGTYIRKLIHDLGEKINGAHMLELRRTKAGIFDEKNSVNIFQLTEAVESWKKGNENPLRKILIPGEIVSEIMPVIQIKKEFINKLHHGSPLFKEYLAEKFAPKSAHEKIAVFHNNSLIGIFSSIIHKEIIAQPEFVLQPINKK